MSKAVRKAGRPAIPRYTRARRAYMSAHRKYQELNSQPAPPKPIELPPGRPPVPHEEKLRRAKVAMKEALEKCRQLEKELGLPELSPAKLRAVEDYAEGQGRPNLGRIVKLFKERRRLVNKLDALKEEPAETYKRAMDEWKSRASSGVSPGRKPLTKTERVSRVDARIRELTAEINEHPSMQDPASRLDVERSNAQIEVRQLKQHAKSELGLKGQVSTLDLEQHERYFTLTYQGRMLHKLMENAEARLHEIEDRIDRLKRKRPENMTKADLIRHVEALEKRLKEAQS